ncbi:MAG: FecR domain-containing protein [Deltaproteobacteria bacterium]|nr:FecR domain-containing protein [Deltaproteobacteria bacterium]
MRRRVAAALGIAACVILFGYLLFGILFDEDDETPKKNDDVENPAKPAIPPKPAARKAPPPISVVEVEGSVQRKASDSKWIPVQTGDALLRDDAIRTDDGARAVLDIGKTATVEVSEKSEFSVREISQTVSKLRLEEGRISAVVTGDGGSVLKVEAKGSDAVAEMEKGEFAVLTDGKGQVSVATQKGQARLSAAGETVEIQAGMQSVVQPGGAPSGPEAIPKSLFLKVKRPSALVMRKKETVIEGRTNPGVVISVNHVQVAVDESGSFRKTVSLSEGKNQVVVAAEDVMGRREEEALPAITVDTKPPRVHSKIKWGNKTTE